MKYRKLLFVIGCLSLLLCHTAFGAKTDDSLLMALDKTLAYEKEFNLEKEQKIRNLKKELDRGSYENIHDIYFRLFKEYEAYIFDSALVYVQKHLEISELEKNQEWINECKMQLARMYSTFARFSDAIELMYSVDRTILNPEQMGAYYNSFAEIYAYCGEYNSDGDLLKYISLRDTYQDSAIRIFPRNTYSYDINYGRRCIEMSDFAEAEKILLPYLSTITANTRYYAILTSIIAYLYETKGDVAQ